MMLDVIAFTVHLKMKYHSDLGYPIVVTIKARLIHEKILKNSLETIVSSEKIRTKVREAINVLNLDVRVDEILQHEEHRTSSGGKMKTLRSIMDCEF